MKKRMKKISIPCDFNGEKIVFPIYVGEPLSDLHPLYFQAKWLTQERGGRIPQEVMDSFEKLHTIAKDNNTSFEDLCVYALNSSNSESQT